MGMHTVILPVASHPLFATEILIWLLVAPSEISYSLLVGEPF
jgi:hypothetical protein